MIVRIWRSLRMFRSQRGCRGVLFTTAADGRRAVMSFWEDASAVDELDSLESYIGTVAALNATGILRGEQTVELLEVRGGAPPG